jgi:GT2 family glycosyltransferase
VIPAAVVICAHTDERRRDLEAAVASVGAQEPTPAQVIVVVDHNPTMLTWAADRFPGVLVVDNPGPAGESGARNAGVAHVTAPVVAFLDDDAVAEPGWLSHLLRWYEDDDVLGVGGAADPRWVSGRPPWFPREFDWVVGCSYRGLPDEAAPIRNLMGCNMSFRTDTVRAVDGFYSGLGRTGGDGFGCSETEFCIRVQRELGGQFVFEPGARVRHRVPPDRGTWTYFAKRCRAEGLSKARLARRAGQGEALALERRYVRETLPRGVARNVREAIVHDRSGVSRALAIVVGAGLTAASYAGGRLRPGDGA